MFVAYTAVGDLRVFEEKSTAAGPVNSPVSRSGSSKCPAPSWRPVNPYGRYRDGMTIRV